MEEHPPPPLQKQQQQEEFLPRHEEEHGDSAHLIAAIARHHAEDAKARARALAGAAVKAAARAKAALDAAYRAAREQARWRIEASKMGVPWTVESVGTAHNLEGTTSEKRKFETVASNDDYSRQTKRPLLVQDESAGHFHDVAAAPTTPGTASHDKETLPAIATPEASRVPSYSQVAVHPDGVISNSTGFRQDESFTSAYQMQNDLEPVMHGALCIGSQALATTSVSVPSIVEGTDLPGVPTLALPADPVVSICEAGNVGKESCSMLSSGNQPFKTSQVSILGNGLVVTADGSDPMSCPIIGGPVTADTNRQADDEEVKTFSAGPGEVAADDLVDLGALLQGGCDKEGELCNGLPTAQEVLGPVGTSSENALGSGKLTQSTIGSVVLAKHEQDASVGVVSHQLSSVSVVSMYSEQSNGTMLSGEQSRHIYDESTLLATNAFMQKNHRPIMIHMSVTNHGERSIPYSMARASVSTTACSVPLQTTALASVPTGQHM